VAGGHVSPAFFSRVAKGVKTDVPPITIDPHYSPRFYAELWGLSESTVLRWFQDEPGVLKCGGANKGGRRRRVEIRIPVSLAMRIYHQRTA
jgi:hypothetical protein